MISMSIVIVFPKHQVTFYHVPNCPFGSIPAMVLGPLPVVAIGSFDVLRSSTQVFVIEKGLKSPLWVWYLRATGYEKHSLLRRQPRCAAQAYQG